MLPSNIFPTSLLLLALFVATAAGQETRLETGKEESPLAAGASLPAGFTEMSTTETGVVGIYESDGKVVKFETRRGHRRPSEMLASFPELSANEIDTRFMDEEGRVFFVHYGGAGPMDKSWELSNFESGSNSQEVEDSKAADRFALAIEALDKLNRVRFARIFEQEHRSLASLVNALRTFQLVEKVEDDAATSGALAACTYRNDIAIHDAPIGGGGRHSATIMKNIAPSGTTTTGWLASNHGRVATDMPKKCSWRSSANRCQWTTLYKCNTPYSSTSLGKHNCNDDTELQYQAIRDNVCPSGLGGGCSDWLTNFSPDNCY